MIIIPLKPVPSQDITITLGGQQCQIDVRTRRTGVFLDLHVSGNLLIAGALCLDRNPIVRSLQFGFVGDLAFRDTLGADDPNYTGFGTRFLLTYLTLGDFIG